MENLATPGGGEQDELLQILARDLDPATLEIVRAKLYDAHRLSVIRDAFMEGKDALAVKMIRDLDDYRMIKMLPLSQAINVAPGQSFQIWARPQLPFRPKHLLISSWCAPHLMINEIRIGNRSQFVQAGDIPADIFNPEINGLAMEADAHGFVTFKISERERRMYLLPLDMETVQTSMDVTLVCTNISPDVVLQRFGGAMLGTTAHH